MLENLLLGKADWLVHQGEGWQGGFAALHSPYLTFLQVRRERWEERESYSERGEKPRGEWKH